MEKAEELRARLKKICRVRMDDSEQSPGWKFSQYEMKGVPLRLEIGPKDIEKNQCVLVRGITGKRPLSLWMSWRQKFLNCWRPFARNVR